MTSPTSPHTDSTVQNNPHDQPHNQPNNQSQNQPQQDDRLARQIARHQPLYGANPGNAFARYFSKYAVFTGRASRSEYWWMQFWAMIVETIVAPLIIGGMATFAVIPLINAVQGDSINWTLFGHKYWRNRFCYPSLLAGFAPRRSRFGNSKPVAARASTS